MIRNILVLCLLASSWMAQAHQADLSTTMLVEQNEDQWVFQIRASLTAFQYEVRTHFAETPYKTPEEFKDFVIEHVKNNVTIYFNETDSVTLRNPYVKLGHETNVVFEVVGVPKNIASVFVKNSSFNNIHRNKSALVLLKKGFEKEQFVLNNDNEHSAELIVNEKSFELKDNQNISVASFSNSYMKLGLIILLLGSLTYLGIKFSKRRLNRN